MTTAYSGDYQGGKRQTCILYEGAITIDSTTGTHYAGGLNKMPTWSAAEEISKGDYVGLFVDTGNTHAATKGIPVVTTLAATNGIIGRVVTEPEWQEIPQSTTSVWATDLAAENYRTAVVELFNVTAIHTAATDGGSTAITVGAPLQWDLSGDGYKDAGTTATGAFSFHYDVNTSASEVLIGFGAVTFTTGDDDCMGIETVA